jgi:hypothetical protein
MKPKRRQPRLVRGTLKLCWRSCALRCPAQRRAREQACGIERRQRRIRVVHDQRDLSAAEYDSVAALVFHPSDDLLKVHDRLGLEDVTNQLIHDDAVEFFAFGAIRAHTLQSVRCESFWINLALDKPASSGQAEAPEAALGSLRGNYLGDVQPKQRRSRFNVRKRPVDGVVGAYQEIGTDVADNASQKRYR